MLEKPEKKTENGTYLPTYCNGFNQSHDLWQAYHTQEIQWLTLSEEDIQNVLIPYQNLRAFIPGGDILSIAKAILKLQEENKSE